MILTFLISLFEVHGSLISTSQLLSSDTIGVEQYEKLVEVSLLASYASKSALVLFLGSSSFRRWGVLTLLPAMFFLALHLLGWIHLY